MSSTIILRSGERFDMENVSTTRLKRMRREKADFTITFNGGEKRRINGSEIKKIVPNDV